MRKHKQKNKPKTKINTSPTKYINQIKDEETQTKKISLKQKKNKQKKNNNKQTNKQSKIQKQTYPHTKYINQIKDEETQTKN